MKILVLEYITGGGMRQEDIPHSLSIEGEMMLNALVDDLLALSMGLELVVLRDDRLPLLPHDGIKNVMVGVTDTFMTAWTHWISRCDAAWPIAPETGGILEQLCLDVEIAGKALLACPSVAVRLAASKLATVRRLAESGLPVVETVAMDGCHLPTGNAFVVKPDDGVGCEGIAVIREHGQLQAHANTEGLIVQPLLEGEPASLSVLFASGKARLLSCNRQSIERAGDGFILKGCVVNAFPDADGSMQVLAEKVALAMPELWGYAGIDLMMTENGPVILEINPRLTTSYAGLRLATGENPAGSVLDLLKTGQLPAYSTQTGKPMRIDIVKSCDD